MDVLASEEPDFHRLKEFVDEVTDFNVDIDHVSVAFMVRLKVDHWMNAFNHDPKQVHCFAVYQVLQAMWLNFRL